MERWDEVIRLISGQLDTPNSARTKEFESFVKQVMELSIKNKEILKEMISAESSRLQSVDKNQFSNSRIDEILGEQDL